MSQFSCDSSGITTFIRDDGTVTFDRAAGVAKAGWTQDPVVMSRFAIVDKLTGLAKTHPEVQAVIPAVNAATPALPSLAVAQAVIERFETQGTPGESRGIVAADTGLQSADVQTIENAVAAALGITTLEMAA